MFLLQVSFWIVNNLLQCLCISLTFRIDILRLNVQYHLEYSIIRGKDILVKDNNLHILVHRFLNEDYIVFMISNKGERVGWWTKSANPPQKASICKPFS